MLWFERDAGPEPIHVLCSFLQEGKENAGGECASSGVYPGGGEVAGTGSDVSPQGLAAASAAPITPDSKPPSVQWGSKGGIKCSDKQAKKKKSKNRKNK